jgi:predicted transcriptional regulator
VFLFTMIGSSITARLLIILRKRDMQLDEINAAFPTSGMVDDRMRNLLSNGFIRAEANSSYVLTRKGWILVMGFRPLRSFFRRTRAT